MKKYLSCSLLTLSIFASSFAIATDCSAPRMDKEIYDCSVIAMNSAETVLNSEYKQLKLRIDTSYEADQVLGKALWSYVKGAQIAWLKYRDNNCKAEAFIAEVGTNAHATIINNCIVRMDNNRVEELKKLPN